MILENIEPLPSFQEVEAAAGNNNPQLRVALAAMKAANQEVAVAWNSFLAVAESGLFLRH